MGGGAGSAATGTSGAGTEESSPRGSAPGGGGRVQVGVVVPAAGAGRRMGGARKPFLELAGEPVLLRALRPFLADGRVVAAVVALPDEMMNAPPAWLTQLGERVRLVAGGETRTESVRRALAALPDALDVIAVHDAARPLIEAAVVAECIDLAASGIGAVAGCPAVDTIKRVGPELIVTDTPDRSTLWHAQTPQAFPADALRAAYADPKAQGTDDAALVERTGLRVIMVDAGPRNLKITHEQDVLLAEAVLAGRGSPATGGGRR